MDIKELNNKETKELHQVLAEKRHELRDMRAKVSARELKNVRVLRVLKRTVARIITVLNSRRTI